MSESDLNPDGNTPGSTAAGINAPQPPPASTPRSLVDDWLKQYYLDYELKDKFQNRITMQGFTDTTRLDLPTCWLPEQLTSTALALATKKWRQSNVLVLSDFSMQRLYDIGVGKTTVPELITSWPIQQQVLDDNKRRIVVPCSDSVLDKKAVDLKHNKLVLEKPEKNAANKDPRPEQMDIDEAARTQEPDVSTVDQSNEPESTSSFSGNSGSRTTSIDELRNMRVEFEPMDEAQINQWMGRHPLGTESVLNTTTDLWGKKLVLQGLFGGIQDMSKDHVNHWADNDPFFKDKTLKSNQILKVLGKRAIAFPKGDYRGRPNLYPEYYLKQVNYVATSTTTPTIVDGKIEKPKVAGRTREVSYPSGFGPGNISNFATLLQCLRSWAG
jgi:hypothetical protein